MSINVSANLDTADTVRIRRMGQPGLNKTNAQFALALGPSIAVTISFVQLLELAAAAHEIIDQIVPMRAVPKPEPSDEDAHKITAPLACQPTCAVCGKRKAPQYRDVPSALAGSLCDIDCRGYDTAPRANSLWVGEEAAAAAE